VKKFKGLLVLHHHASHLVAGHANLHVEDCCVIWEGQHCFSCHDLLNFVESGLLFCLQNPF